MSEAIWGIGGELYRLKAFTLRMPHNRELGNNI